MFYNPANVYPATKPPAGKTVQAQDSFFALIPASASESGEKDVNECMFAGKMCLIDCGVS